LTPRIFFLDNILVYCQYTKKVTLRYTKMANTIYPNRFKSLFFIETRNGVNMVKPALNPKTDAPTQRERRKENFRKAILSATTLTFFEKGYEAATLDEIAGKAGVTKRTLYKYFPSKIALFVSMFDEYLQELNALIAETAGLDVSTDKKLLLLISNLIQFSRKNEHFMRQFMFLNIRQFGGKLPDELLERVDQLNQTMIRQATEVVRQGIKEGVVIDTDPETLTHLVIAICKGIFVHADAESVFLKTAGIDPDKLFNTFFMVLMKDVIKVPRKKMSRRFQFLNR
jgi:AcrR family transcriptional regulator